MPNFHMERKNYAYKKEFPIPGCHFGQKKNSSDLTQPSNTELIQLSSPKK